MMQLPQPVLPLMNPPNEVRPTNSIAALMGADQASNQMLSRLVEGPLQPEPVDRRIGDPYVQELDRQIASIFMPQMLALMGMFGGGMQGGMNAP